MCAWVGSHKDCKCAWVDCICAWVGSGRLHLWVGLGVGGFGETACVREWVWAGVCGWVGGLANVPKSS
jgi:hypothetical protein